MIYCFARAQPKPTKREEEENTTTNARQKASRQQSGGQASRKAAFYPATVCVPSKSVIDRLDFINHSSGWTSKIIICSKVPS